MRLLLAAAAVLALTFAASAATPVRTISSPQKVVPSGSSLILARINSIRPDCSSAGTASVGLLGGPSHGRFAVQQTRAHPRYPAGNPRNKCNRRAVPGQQLIYTPNPGYRGGDAVVFQIGYPNGTADRVRIPILVK